MDEKIIDSIEKFKAKDNCFNPLNIFVYKVDLNTKFIDLKFISYGNFNFKGDDNIRYSLQKKYLGCYRCSRIISHNFDPLGLSFFFQNVEKSETSEKSEITQKEISQQIISISKNFWGRKTIKLFNPAVGHIKIVCKSIAYHEFENVNREKN